MKTEMQIQQENVATLLKLVAENPELRIVPMVDSEIVADDGHNWWVGSFGHARVDEIFAIDERLYIRSTDEDTLIEELCMDAEDDAWDEAEKLAREKVAGYAWERVIAVKIDLP